MLELRPNCEWCDADLPPDSKEAMICSYECTYCADCVETVLQNVCATCGGGFAPRPIRPKRNHREGERLGRENHPGSTERVNSKWTETQLVEQRERLKPMQPHER